MALKPGERDEIVPQLWIGDFASTKDKEALRKSKITHILTVAKELAEVDKASLSEFNHKNYDFEDADDQLVLPSFEEINEFIKGGIAAGGVLVVSYSGVSRCALIALEYLMGLMNLTYEEAVKMVTERRLVSLNHNFVVQLKLYETMKCKFNRKSKKFATFQATLKDEHSAKRDLFKKAGAYVPHDPQMVARLKTLCKKQAETELKKKSFGKTPKDVEQGKLFACANCRHKLFAPNNIITEDSDLKDWSDGSFIYIEPLEWIKGDLNNIQGDFQCPECHIGLGQWDWEGSLISANTKVVPSFRIHKAHLCSLSKKNAKSKEKVTFGYKGWEGFVKEHPLGYPSPFLPEITILSPRSSAPEAESSDGEKELEKKKDGDEEDETKPKRKPPPPPKKGSQKEVSEGDDSSAERLSNSGKHEEDKKAGGLKGFMGRFKKKNGKQSPPEKSPGSGIAPKARKAGEAKPAPEQKNSNEDFGEDNIQPVSKAQAQEALELTCPEDLPKEILKVIKNSKISDEDMADNFIILLNCLHFLTKRHFIIRPKREEGDTEEKGEEEVIKIGGAKKKKKKKVISNLPPASELVTEGDVKKAYKMQEIVGEGGFGRVHSARNLKGKGRVAIKKMAHVLEREKQRNFKEINFLRTVDHPCIVKYFCSYVVKEELWVVMEFMEGGTLTEALKGFSFEEKHIAYAAKEMLKGIKYLHARNLVHRDLKSGNIMMTTQGDVKLIDFGLCVDLAEEKEPEHMVGSPFWMPPEMIKRQIYGPAVDIWSFAICVLELANGQPPNRRSALKAMFVAGTTGYPQPFNKPEHWSSNFKDFIGRCLEMEPSKRASAEELLKHPFLEKADTKKGMKKILSHIFLQNTIDMMNLGGI